MGLKDEITETSEECSVNSVVILYTTKKFEGRKL